MTYLLDTIFKIALVWFVIKPAQEIDLSLWGILHFFVCFVVLIFCLIDVLAMYFIAIAFILNKESSVKEIKETNRQTLNEIISDKSFLPKRIILGIICFYAFYVFSGYFWFFVVFIGLYCILSWYVKVIFDKLGSEKGAI